MRKRRTGFGVAVLVAASVVLLAADPPKHGLPRAESRATVRDAAEAANLEALHDRDSPSYDGDCLSCHDDVLTRPSLDPRILSFHQAMVPYTPGYNPAHGPNNEVCVQCHRFVELRVDSAGALRKHVNPELCALCHGPSGPGQAYYKR